MFLIIFPRFARSGFTERPDSCSVPATAATRRATDLSYYSPWSEFTTAAAPVLLLLFGEEPSYFDEFNLEELFWDD